MIVTIITFIIILGLLVFVHEFGHFFVARRSGMKIEEFGFGFPPRLAGIQKIEGKYKFVWGHKPPQDPNRTVYSINWIPLGGFVKILGENNEEENNPQSFINRPFSARLLTLLAGVTMNVILAWVLVSIGFGLGLPTALGEGENLPKGASFSNPQVAIMDVLPGQNAAKAGLAAGDIILKIDGVRMDSLNQVHDYVAERAGQTFNFEVKRVDKTMDFKVNSEKNPGPDKGPTGIQLADIGKLKFPWYSAGWEGAKTIAYQIQNIFSGLYQIFTSKAGLSAVGGPVKIAQLTGQVAKMGFIYLLQFTAFLSLNLAILNVLPIPALDGGRVLFLLIEKIRGRKNNQKIEQWVNAVGFVALLCLMLLVTVKDISSFGGISAILGKLIGK